MAKKKVTKKRKPTRRRRSRVSGVGMLPGVPLEQIAAFAGGAIASQALNGIAKNVSALQKNAKILPLIKIGIGVFALAKSNNEMLKNMGGGFVAEGALQLVRVAAPNVFNTLNGEPVGSIGTTLIDLDGISGNGNYLYGEDQQVGALYDEDYSVGAV